MLLKRYLIVVSLTLPLFAGMQNLSLPSALNILKKENLELKVSRFNEKMKAYEVQAVEGLNYGKLDLSVAGLRSNDAGNVFGFKLQSREATFGAFGFSEFDPTNPNILDVQPEALNYPDARNHFPVKLSYKIPLYTGGKLTEYRRITESMQKMSQFDTKKLLNTKIFETKKIYYDISLVENYIATLSTIKKNIYKLQSVVTTMKDEGYAQGVDVLEVEAHKAEVDSLLNQAKLNKELAYQFLSFLLNTEVSSVRRVREMAPMPDINNAALEMNNIDIQKAKLGLVISEMAVEAEKANFRPEAGAFAEYGSADDKIFNEFFDKDSYTVGIQLKWNLFNGGVDEANLEKAKVAHLKVRNQVELAKKGIGLQVKKLRSQVLSANADVRNYKKQLRFASKVYESYKARYKEGMVSISDVIMKQSKELEVLLKLLTAKHKRNTKVFELDSILNRGGEV